MWRYHCPVVMNRDLWLHSLLDYDTSTTMSTPIPLSRPLSPTNPHAVVLYMLHIQSTIPLLLYTFSFMNRSHTHLLLTICPTASCFPASGEHIHQRLTLARRSSPSWSATTGQSWRSSLKKRTSSWLYASVKLSDCWFVSLAPIHNNVKDSWYLTSSDIVSLHISEWWSTKEWLVCIWSQYDRDQCHDLFNPNKCLQFDGVWALSWRNPSLFSQHVSSAC